MRKGLVLLALLAAMPNALAPTISAQAADSSYLSLVRRLVSDSLRGAGRRAGERFFASDSATRALLKASGVIGASMEPPPPVLNCPDIRLTGAEASPVGYKVDVRESPRCRFIPEMGRGQGKLHLPATRAARHTVGVRPVVRVGAAADARWMDDRREGVLQNHLSARHQTRTGLGRPRHSRCQRVLRAQVLEICL